MHRKSYLSAHAYIILFRGLYEDVVKNFASLLINCCKCTVCNTLIKHKTKTHSQLFHSHKMRLLAFLETDMTDFPTLLYTVLLLFLKLVKSLSFLV